MLDLVDAMSTHMGPEPLGVAVHRPFAAVTALCLSFVTPACGSSSAAPKGNGPTPDASLAAPDFTDTLPQPAVMANASTAPSTVEVSLDAAVNKLALAPGKPATTAWTYNASVPGPTLVATEGDHVIVHFTNHLPQPTNVHWHGLHIPADQDGNPTSPIEPGGGRDYVFDLPEGSAGTYWYHPHPQGKAAEQVTMGLYGAIIVRAKNDPLPKGLVDDLVILNDNRFDADGAVSAETMDDQMNGRQGDVVFANGVVNPTMTLRPGELRHLRVVNASAARYYKLNVPGHALTWIGTSGGLFGAPQWRDEVLVVPGERVELLLQATAAAGTTTTLKALAYDRGLMSMGGPPPPVPKEVDLLSIAYTSDMTLNGPALPDRLREIAPIDTTNAVQRTFVLSEQMMSFMIDGKTYDPKRVDTKATLGATEVWTIRNDSDMDHPFHLHGFQFQVLDRNGTPEPFVAWNDTLNVPKRTSARFAVKLDLPGMRMYHCHILEHEDLGMMGTLDVE